MDFKHFLVALAVTGAALAQTTPEGTTVVGTVYQVEPSAVYIRTPDTTAHRVPVTATFLVAGQPVTCTSLRNGQMVTVQYPSDSFEVIAGPLPPNADNLYFHRSIKRGALVLDQNFVNGAWVDVATP
jgi:hypothetical protein